MAFASTYAQEVKLGPGAWRERITGAAQFLAFERERLVGTATAVVDAQRPGEVKLTAMYVVPAARGRRVAAALVGAVVTEARARTAARVLLFVVESNASACAAYRRLGFAPTGTTVPLPHSPALIETEMALTLYGR